ncbi:MAG: hypothetical protein ACYTBJ_19485, partial [Planctomycetota bacterium]
MKKECVSLLSALLVSLTVTPSATAIRYTVTDLGTLPGYDAACPYSINNRGQIAGYVVNFDPTVYQRAVLFDADGTGNDIDLGALGGQDSVTCSINNNGQVVGTAESDEDPSKWYVTIFDSNGSGNNCSLNAEGAAFSNNDNGQVAGLLRTYPIDANEAVERAALFQPDSEPNTIDLGTLPGYDAARAYSINNNGLIVGITFHAEHAGICGLTRAVLFDNTGDGNNIDLGALPGYDYATAFSINNGGQIAGRVNSGDICSPAGSDCEVRAVLFEPTGQGNNIDLGTLPGYDSTEAFCINNKGRIVGRAIHTGQYYHQTAVLFDRRLRGNNIDLNDCIDPGLGCTLTEAIAINDNGWIVCWGGKPGSDASAFLLKPISAGPADFEPDTDVDLEDFAVLAAAWRAGIDDDNWNQACDMFPDGIIDGRDLRHFA